VVSLAVFDFREASKFVIGESSVREALLTLFIGWVVLHTVGDRVIGSPTTFIVLKDIRVKAFLTQVYKLFVNRAVWDNGALDTFVIFQEKIIRALFTNFS
jgi:hypothetical protein